MIAHTATTPSVHLFMAAEISLKLGRLEDAGFLFYAAQLRSLFDQQRFPAVGQGSESPWVLLGALSQQVGAVVNPALNGEPKSFKAVVERMRAWDVQTAEGYDPGWKYASPKPAAEARALGERLKQDYLELAEGFATLLNTPEYFRAYKTLQDFNQGPFQEMQKPERIAEKEKAEMRLREIEAKMGIPGVFYRKPTAAPPSDGRSSKSTRFPRPSWTRF